MPPQMEEWRGKPQTGWQPTLKSAYNKRLRIQVEMERFSSAMMKSEAWAATKLDELQIARKESFTQQLATMRRGNSEVPKRASRGQKAPRRRIARATIMAAQRNEAESTAVRRLRERVADSPGLLAGRTRPLVQPATPDGRIGRDDSALRYRLEFERREFYNKYLRVSHELWHGKSPQAHLDQNLHLEFRAVLQRHGLQNYQPGGKTELLTPFKNWGVFRYTI
jgi:hypothetical protein